MGRQSVFNLHTNRDHFLLNFKTDVLLQLSLVYTYLEIDQRIIEY